MTLGCVKQTVDDSRRVSRTLPVCGCLVPPPAYTRGMFDALKNLGGLGNIGGLLAKAGEMREVAALIGELRQALDHSGAA